MKTYYASRSISNTRIIQISTQIQDYVRAPTITAFAIAQHYWDNVAVATKDTTPTMIPGFVGGEENRHKQSKFVVSYKADRTIAQNKHVQKIQRQST